MRFSNYTSGNWLVTKNWQQLREAASGILSSSYSLTGTCGPNTDHGIWPRREPNEMPDVITVCFTGCMENPGTHSTFRLYNRKKLLKTNWSTLHYFIIPLLLVLCKVFNDDTKVRLYQWNIGPTFGLKNRQFALDIHKTTLNTAYLNEL